jgi:hypothetical protein
MNPSMNISTLSLDAILGQQAQPSALGELSGSAARETAAKLDGLLTIQINAHLGAGSWVLTDLRGRLTRITDKDHTSEIWELDGKPILQTWPVKIETVTEGHAIKMVVTQPCRTFSPKRKCSQPVTLRSLSEK